MPVARIGRSADRGCWGLVVSGVAAADTDWASTCMARARSREEMVRREPGGGGGIFGRGLVDGAPSPGWEPPESNGAVGSGTGSWVSCGAWATGTGFESIALPVARIGLALSVAALPVARMGFCEAGAFVGAFLAGAFFFGGALAGSSGCSSLVRPSRSALRRTRSAWASIMPELWLFTPTPRFSESSKTSLLVIPSSRASSKTRIFFAAKVIPVLRVMWLLC